MTGTFWAIVILASGIIALASAIVIVSWSGIFIGACFTVMGAGMLWHNDRFVRATTRR